MDRGYGRFCRGYRWACAERSGDDDHARESAINHSTHRRQRDEVTEPQGGAPPGCAVGCPRRDLAQCPQDNRDAQIGKRQPADSGHDADDVCRREVRPGKAVVDRVPAGYAGW